MHADRRQNDGRMPFDLPLPESLAARGWKAKIRDRERLETPHITVLFKTRNWRISLRNLAFLDTEPPPREVPRAVLAVIEGKLGQLRAAWDALNPDNPV